jgi:hypothetical protein
MRSRTDKAFLVLSGVFVAGLAFVAGAISFAHMTELATRHDQTGWKAFAFPVSVDGLELVASLYILAQRRAGRRPGLLPWAALLVGTAASLAANVAVGGHDPVGRALAGWPAVSLLVSIKLFFAMFDHDIGDPDVRDDQRPPAPGAAVPGTVHGTGPDDQAPAGTVSDERTNRTGPSPAGADGGPAVPDGHRDPSPGGPVDVRGVADLTQAARAARAALAAEGRPLTRDALAKRMREDGHAISNARASQLLKILRTNDAPARVRGKPVEADAGEIDMSTEVAA